MKNTIVILLFICGVFSCTPEVHSQRLGDKLYVVTENLQMSDEYLYKNTFYESRKSLGLKLELRIYPDYFLVKSECHFERASEANTSNCLLTTTSSIKSWLEILIEEEEIPLMDWSKSKVLWKDISKDENYTLLQKYNIER
ncbi:hypothetical protein [Kangiella sediminilitoris]|uniref:Lipoprotein n=1 Tax=Kangiella sediminilitoris TaxID=1144748 RepID=A0A1B3BA44_9GAMM|nr:hypothetical protein [Kangiella sediminilitoris]AOE49638.1 hypothetical protein KS2013_916 [Kangiella sediminilitoris]